MVQYDKGVKQMKFIRVWSYSLANFLSTSLNESHQKKGIYYYGFQVLIGGIIKFMMLAVVSLILGAFLPTMVLMVSFSLLRLVTGGYHMDTFGRCAIVSITMFVIGGVLSRYTYQYVNFIIPMILILLAFIAELYCIIKYSPRDNPNRPITNKKEITKFRKLAVFNLLMLEIINIILILYNANMYSLSVTFGIGTAAFIISPVGYKFFDFINGKKT